MKNKIFFRVPAIIALKHFTPSFEYFDSTCEDQYLPTAKESLEYEIFRMVGSAWEHWRNRSRASVGDEYQQKVWIKTMLRHLRAAWNVCESENDLLAKYEFRTAETYWLRLGILRLADIAGETLLKQQVRRSIGIRSSERRWKKTEKERLKRDKEIKRLAMNGSALISIAERYGLEPRRIQQIVKKAK